MKRVAITGLGVITPVGNDVNTFWENLTAGVCGIGPITKFPTDDLKVKIAAEVKDFDPAAFGMDVPTARKLDLYTQYALAAAKQAVEDSGIAESGLAPERFGVYVGSGIGGMNTFVNETQKLMQRGPSRVSPFFIPMMIGNLSLIHIFQGNQRLLEQVNRDNFFIYYDGANIENIRGEDGVAFYTQMAGAIRQAHAKDLYLAKPWQNAQPAVLGEGECHAWEILETMRAYDFSGWIFVENGHNRERLKRDLEMLKRYFD